MILLEPVEILKHVPINHIFIKQYKPTVEHTIFDSGRFNAYIFKCNITDHLTLWHFYY